MKILLIEDDTSTAHSIIRGIQEENYVVDHSQHREEALDSVSFHNYDLIILNPDTNGNCLCRTLRQKGIETPVMLLSAKDTIQDKVRGLESGADDYITKPFAFDEFRARVHTLLRRKHNKFIEMEFGRLMLDTVSHRVYFGNKTIDLSAKEYALLYYLLRNKDRVLTRNEIIENVWGQNYDPSTNIVDVYIKKLRAILTPLFNRNIIKTVRGKGYIVSSILT